MPHQIKIAYSATAANNVTPAALLAAMMAVPLYTNATQDEVLGRLFGLTVLDSVGTIVGSVVTRTITLNMDAVAGAPVAPPTFAGEAASTPTDNQAAIWSTSVQDSDVLVGAIGAKTVSITYTDAEGHTATVSVNLDGQTPVPIPLAPGTNGIATIIAEGIVVVAAGALGSSVGQITVAVLGPPPPAEEQEQLEEGEPSAQPQSPQDVLQMRLGACIAYLPNSYYSYAMQTNPSQTLVEPPSIGVTLPQTVINVASTAAFPASGTIDVPTTTGTSTVTYSGVTPTSFTGCSGGTGTITGETEIEAPAPALPTPLLLQQYMTNFFTNALSLALATPVTAAPPVLV